MPPKTYTRLALVLSSVGMLMPTTAPAQEAGSNALEEIVVTARKRSESVLDVPISINVISEQAIERLGAEDFTDLLTSVPSLTAYENGPGRTRLSIRGIANGGGNDNDTQNQETVGIYMDEVPISMGAMNPEFNLFDLKRVEVLRGPQGTLYGAGSLAGTVRLVSNQPDLSEFSGKVDASVLSVAEGDQGGGIKGLINVPIIPGKLALRASSYFTDTPGYIDNALTGESDLNRALSRGLKLSTLYQATDDLSATFTFINHDYTDNGRPEDLDRAPELSRDFPSFDGYDDEMQLYNLTINYNLGWGELVSSTSYFDRFVVNRRSLDDLFGAALPPTVIPNELVDSTDTETLVQEIRVSSDNDGRLNWTAGVYFDERDTFYLNTFPVPGADAALGIDSPSLYGAPVDNLFWGFDDLTVKTAAIFGEVYYDIDRWTITLGMRYFDWEQDIDFYQSGLFNGGSNSDPRPTGEEDGVNPKLNVSYDVNDEWLIFGQAARGFRYGGINGAIPEAVCAEELAEVSRQGGDTRFFDSDSTWNYELGTKGSFADGAMTLSATVFSVQWSDTQTQRSFECGFGFRENVGELTSQGIEFEYDARFGDALTFTLGGAYMKAELDQDVPNLGALEGDKAPFVPELTLNTSLEYQTPLSPTLDSYTWVNAQYVDERSTEFDLENSNNKLMDSYTLVNFRTGIVWDRMDISLFINNLTDSRAVVRALGRPPFDPDARIRVQPRTIGVSLRAFF
ncbi:MAG: TonB-dependent receptor [Pseudomonadota bacterium]